MFNIKINKDLLAYLGERKMRIDELFVIMCFGLNKIDLLRVFLQGRTGDQCTAFMQSLERKALLEKLSPDVDNFDWDNYKVTIEGNRVYEDCQCNIIEGIQEIEIVNTDPVDEGDVPTLVSEFMAIWPQDSRNINGDKLLSHPADIEKRMRAFVRKYKFDKDTILRATENYVTRQRAQGYAYCNQAHYFIAKDGISKLAGECELAERNTGNTSTWDNVI